MNDIINIFILRIRLFTKSKSVMAAFIIAIVISCVMVWTFADTAEEKSNIPIGVIDNDRSDMSNKLVKALKEDNSILVIEGNEDYLNSELDKGNIYSIFIINDRFEDKILSMDTEKLIEHRYLEANDYMAILSDVVLGKMLDDICYTKSLNEYHKLADEYKIESDEVFRAYVNELYDEYEAMFSFDLEVVDVVKDKSVTDNVDNSIIYKEVILAIICMLIGFIALFAGNIINTDKKYKTDDRIRLSAIGPLACLIGDTLAMFSICIAFAMFAGGIFSFRIGGFKLGASYICMLLVYTFCICFMYMLLSRWIKESILYQLIGAATVFVLGISAVLDILSIFMPKAILRIVSYVPSALMNKGLAQLIINNYANEQQKIMLIDAVILLFVLLISELIRNRNTHIL